MIESRIFVFPTYSPVLNIYSDWWTDSTILKSFNVLTIISNVTYNITYTITSTTNLSIVKSLWENSNLDFSTLFCNYMIYLMLGTFTLFHILWFKCRKEIWNSDKKLNSMQVMPYKNIKLGVFAIKFYTLMLRRWKKSLFFIFIFFCKEKTSSTDYNSSLCMSLTMKMSILTEIEQKKKSGCIKCQR